MEQLLFKRVGLSQLSKLREMSISTFVESFRQFNTTKDLEIYTSDKMSIAQLKAELENPNSTFYFALLENEIVGYIKINVGTAQNEQHYPDALEIERLYVIAPWQGKGIGSKLLDFAIALAKTKKLSKVWLGVWEKNHGAKKLYTRYGFREFSSHPFLLGEDLQTDLLMKMEI